MIGSPFVLILAAMAESARLAPPVRSFA